jgi:hypothetical protein
MFAREKNIQTLYTMADRHFIDRQVVIVAVNMIDRCLSLWVPKISSGGKLPYELDVYFMTAFYLAIKTHVGRATTLGPLSKLLSRYSEELLEQAEVDILYELEWNVFYPSPVMVVGDLLSVVSRVWGMEDSRFVVYWRDVCRESTFLIELATLSYGCSVFRPISVALAAVMCTIPSINRFLIPHVDSLQLFKVTIAAQLGDVGISCDDGDVQECFARMSALPLYNYQEPQVWAFDSTLHVPVTP